MSNRIVAVVPARGGSKGIPLKNLSPLAGKPMLAWTIKAALDSGVVDRVIVSTDDLRIAEVARQAGAQTPFIRPAQIAQDDVHAVHVVLHALDWMQEHECQQPEGIMMLLPTSPLRLADDVSAAVQLFDERRADAVISVVDLGKYMTNLRYMDGELLQAVDPGEDCNAQRQGLRKLYGVNGSIFLARPAALRQAGSFHMASALGYQMDALRSIDVNTQADLDMVRRMFDWLNPSCSGAPAL